MLSVLVFRRFLKIFSIAFVGVICNVTTVLDIRGGYIKYLDKLLNYQVATDVFLGNLCPSYSARIHKIFRRTVEL